MKENMETGFVERLYEEIYCCLPLVTLHFYCLRNFLIQHSLPYPSSTVPVQADTKIFAQKYPTDEIDKKDTTETDKVDRYFINPKG